MPSIVPQSISKLLPSISTEPAVNLPPNVKAPMFVEFTVVDTTLPKDALDINEPDTSPTKSKDEPESFNVNLPNEAVDA